MSNNAAGSFSITVISGFSVYLKTAVVLVVCLCLFSKTQQSFAQTENGWSGAIELSAASASGNSNYFNLGFSASPSFEHGLYTHLFSIDFNYAEFDGTTDQNLLEAAYEINRELSRRLFLYGRISAEREEFSGLDYRAFIGTGVGIYIIDRGSRVWTIEGGPGARYSRFEEPESPEIDFEAGETEFVFYAASDFDQTLGDGVIFEHDLITTHSELNSSYSSTFALTVRLIDNWSAKISHRTDYETDVPPDTDDTDTLLDLGLQLIF